VEGETGHVLAHALIQSHNGTKMIALGQITPQKAVICTNVKILQEVIFFTTMGLIMVTALGNLLCFW